MIHKFSMVFVYRRVLVSLIILGMLSMGIVMACSGGNSAPPPTEESRGASVTIWTIFHDQLPQTSVDQWLATTLAEAREELDLSVMNVYQDYAHINSQLTIAVSSGGDIPDLSYINSQQLGFHVQHETLQDITDYVTQAAWFDDLEPLALEACTAPDGRIYCVPGHLYSRLIYVWSEQWPDGFPRDTETFLHEAARLKAEGRYAITFKGSETAAAENFFFGLIHSYGGRYADDAQRAAWASSETVEAVRFIRTLVQEGYAPDVVFLPGFEHERTFSDGSAAAFVAGSWSHLYLHPLTSPRGTSFTGASEAVIQAMDAGELSLYPYLAAPGREPVMLITTPAWAIPRGAPNPTQARALLDFLMTTSRNSDYAYAAGGLPTLKSAANDARFRHPYWEFVRHNQERYGQMMPPFRNYDQAMNLLTTAINRVALDPQRDILTELQAAQDAYNASQE